MVQDCIVEKVNLIKYNMTSINYIYHYGDFSKENIEKILSVIDEARVAGIVDSINSHYLCIEVSLILSDIVKFEEYNSKLLELFKKQDQFDEDLK